MERKMKNYKTGLMIFLFFAIIISFFPPFEWQTQFVNQNFTAKATIGKSYDFIFRINDNRAYIQKQTSADFPDFIVSRNLLFVELIVEYLLAGFIAFFVQIVITFAKRK